LIGPTTGDADVHIADAVAGVKAVKNRRVSARGG
jgi:hypothetical protein